MRTKAWNFRVKSEAHVEKQAHWDIYVLDAGMGVAALHPDTT